MNVCIDRRPVTELSSGEVVVYLVQAIRARDLKTVPQVRQVYRELFSDATVEQERAHLGALARALHPSVSH